MQTPPSNQNHLKGRMEREGLRGVKMPVDLGLARGVQERGSHLSFCLRGNSLAHITRKVALITLDPGALITMLRTGLPSSPLPVSFRVGLILRRIYPTWQVSPFPHRQLQTNIHLAWNPRREILFPKSSWKSRGGPACTSSCSQGGRMAWLVRPRSHAQQGGRVSPASTNHRVEGGRGQFLLGNQGAVIRRGSQSRVDPKPQG